MALDGGRQNKATEPMWQELLVPLLITERVFAELHQMQNYMVPIGKMVTVGNLIILRKRHWDILFRKNIVEC